MAARPRARASTVRRPLSPFAILIMVPRGPPLQSFTTNSIDQMRKRRGVREFIQKCMPMLSHRKGEGHRPQLSKRPLCVGALTNDEIGHVEPQRTTRKEREEGETLTNASTERHAETGREVMLDEFQRLFYKPRAAASSAGHAVARRQLINRRFKSKEEGENGQDAAR